MGKELELERIFTHRCLYHPWQKQQLPSILGYRHQKQCFNQKTDNNVRKHLFFYPPLLISLPIQEFLGTNSVTKFNSCDHSARDSGLNEEL